MTRSDIDAARPLILQAIHAHMPSAAVASGWASPVDPAAWVASVSNLIRHVDRPYDLGLTALTRWLAARGIEAGPTFVKALRTAWISDEMACESRK